MRNQTEKSNTSIRAMVLALSLVSFLGLAACSTTSSNSASNTSENGDYIRRAERIADQMPRGKGI